MKTYFKIFTVLFALITGIQANAQRIGDLNGINYQAVAIDEDGKEIVGMDIDGKPLYEKEIGVRFTIQKGEAGEIQYQETHTTLTDQYGLFSLTIGHGEQTGNGSYSDLLSMPWIDADQWLKVEIAIENDGNYRVVSLQQFMTVPYSFYTDDIADDAITTEKILNEEILAEDIATGAVETSEILDETILAEDIATGAVTTDEILDGTVVNADIADNTIDLSAKVTNVLPVENGGTGSDVVNQGDILIGSGGSTLDTLAVNDSIMVFSNANGTTELFKLRAGVRIFINVDPTTKTVEISAVDQSTGPGTGTGTVSVGVIANGSQEERNFPSADVQPGDIILATILQDLQGITLTAYVRKEGHVNVIFYNGTGVSVNLGVVDVRFANFGQP